MMIVYKNIIYSKISQSLYREFLESIYACNQEAILFHCFAGKDRTGLGAAFILKILGVREEDIYEDYELTNIMRKQHNEALLKELADKGVSEEDLQRIHGMLSVKKEYLEYVFKEIDEKYGSFDAYLTNALGLDTHFISNMQERFIVK